MYRSTLRPVVAIITAISAFWALAQAIGYFRNYGVDRTLNVPKLTTYTIVLGAIYMAILVIQIFGFFSAISNRIPFVRSYAYLSIFSTLAVVGAGLLDVVAHFTLKNDIINTCTEVIGGDTLVYYGFWGPVYHTISSTQEAQGYCTDAWSHDSWATILSFIITSIASILFTCIAFGYLHQLMDPTSPVNSARAPSYQARTDGYPSYYNPPYNAYNPTYATAYEGQTQNDYYAAQNRGYAPTYTPQGPPPPIPERDEPFVPPDDHKLPSYSGDGHVLAGIDDKDDPFSVPDERDVTSRPTGGGR